MDKQKLPAGKLAINSRSGFYPFVIIEQASVFVPEFTKKLPFAGGYFNLRLQMKPLYQTISNVVVAKYRHQGGSKGLLYYNMPKLVAKKWMPGYMRNTLRSDKTGIECL